MDEMRVRIAIENQTSFNIYHLISMLRSFISAHVKCAAV